MNPDSARLFAQLRDIHPAPDIPWWPPAPGWWVVAALLVAAVLLLVRRLWRAWQVHRRRQRLVRRLEALERDIDAQARPQDYISAVNRLLKLVALRAFPDEPCARLQGSAWADFVCTRLAKSEAPQDALGCLASGPYEPAPHLDTAALGRAARSWIRRYG